MRRTRPWSYPAMATDSAQAGLQLQHGLRADKTQRLAPAHIGQGPAARMPDHTVGAATGVDQQAPLPGQILHLHERPRAEDPVATLLDAQFAVLATVAARQQVVALGAIQTEQRHPPDITDLPVGVQGMAEPAGFAVLMRG